MTASAVSGRERTSVKAGRSSSVHVRMCVCVERCFGHEPGDNLSLNGLPSPLEGGSCFAGHLNSEGCKMSKSQKNFISIRSAFQSQPPCLLSLIRSMAKYQRPPNEHLVQSL